MITWRKAARLSILLPLARTVSRADFLTRMAKRTSNSHHRRTPLSVTYATFAVRSKHPSSPTALYFTEWSTSYNPRDLVHDSYISAPYILSKLKASAGLVQGMSYWTYTDLFEEPGPPPTPFHGGFGLLNREGIPKPAYFAYKYLHAVRGNEIPLQDSQAFAAIDHDRVATVIWDFRRPKREE